jgi:DNA-binding Lrp family transcriptional regulator
MVADRDIIKVMQEGLPVCPEPYAAIAEQLNIDEQELHTRIEQMLASGIIRRIGLVPNHYRIGYRYNAMTVWELDDNKVDTIGKLLGEQPSVSHCYKRPKQLPEWPFNLFAMVHGRSLDEVNDKIESLRQLIGDDCRQSEVLFSEKILKKTGLRLKNRSDENA